jgi:DNA-binding CsgD family transcriptional regulator
LKNALLNEDKLKAELENKALLEKKLREDLVTKSQVLTSHTLQLIRKNNFLENLKDELREIQKADKKDRGQIVRRIVASINQSFTQDEDWKEFQKVFEQIHPEFYTRLQVRYPELSSSDLRLCALLKLNLNSTDIATILGISLDSLRVSRYRLRKKLKIENGGSLSATLMES